MNLNAITEITKAAYLPAMREAEASLWEGPLFRQPKVAAKIRAMSDDVFMVYFKAAHPL